MDDPERYKEGGETNSEVKRDNGFNKLAQTMEERRARRKQFNLRENLSSQLPAVDPNEQDSRFTGRWSRDEHEKFIEGIFYFP